MGNIQPDVFRAMVHIAGHSKLGIDKRVGYISLRSDLSQEALST